jgi:hypothetical protein
MVLEVMAFFDPILEDLLQISAEAAPLKGGWVIQLVYALLNVVIPILLGGFMGGVIKGGQKVLGLKKKRAG